MGERPRGGPAAGPLALGCLGSVAFGGAYLYAVHAPYGSVAEWLAPSVLPMMLTEFFGVRAAALVAGASALRARADPAAGAAQVRFAIAWLAGAGVVTLALAIGARLPLLAAYALLVALRALDVRRTPSARLARDTRLALGAVVAWVLAVLAVFAARHGRTLGAAPADWFPIAGIYFLALGALEALAARR